jgi:quinol monooxygenase YgiN
MAQTRRSDCPVILSKLRLFPATEQRQQLLAALRSVLGPTQAKPSCLAAQVYEEDGYPTAVLYLEEWDSEPEFRAHVRSELYRRVLASIDLSKSVPELCFYQVSARQGLELVQQIRGLGNGPAPPRKEDQRPPRGPRAVEDDQSRSTQPGVTPEKDKPQSGPEQEN